LTDIHAPQHERQGDGRPAGRLVGREDTLPLLPTVRRDALNVALGFGEGRTTEPAGRIECRARAARQAAVARPLLVIIDDLPCSDRGSKDAKRRL